MRFNVAKCKVMHIGSNNAGSSYYMNGQLLDEVLMHKDLGVIVTCNLKVAEQCSHAYIKANKMLGLVRRTVKYRKSGILL